MRDDGKRRAAETLLICAAVGSLWSFLLPERLLAWGDQGHRIIALVAETRLQPRARAAIADLLGEDGLADAAVWADGVKAARPDTASWHYVDIPVEATRYDPERDCGEGNCLVAQIERWQAVLSDPRSPPTERSDAVKFLVHFVGDLHQPLHCADNRDRGGNEVLVTFFGEAAEPERNRPWNLHAVWDSGLLRRTGLTEVEYARKLSKRLETRSLTRIQRGTVADWALETHRAAVEQAYAVPEDRSLGERYYRASLPVMEELLAKAGVRLARVLNEAFRK